MPNKLIPVSCGLVILFTAAAGCSRPTVSILKTPDINVDLFCNNDGTFTATVAPWAAQADEGKKFSWSLRNATNVDEMEIGESGGKPWPFQAGKKFKVKKSQKIDGQPEAGKTGNYHYAITATCNVPGTGSFQIVIDPDMIIPPRRGIGN